MVAMLIPASLPTAWSASTVADSRSADLDGVRLSPDGSRLILLLRDAAGQKVSLSLRRAV